MKSVVALHIDERLRDYGKRFLGSRMYSSVCVCVCVCVGVHVCVCVRVCVCVWSSLDTMQRVYMYVCVYAFVCMVLPGHHANEATAAERGAAG